MRNLCLYKHHADEFTAFINTINFDDPPTDGHAGYYVEHPSSQQHNFEGIYLTSIRNETSGNYLTTLVITFRNKMKFKEATFTILGSLTLYGNFSYTMKQSKHQMLLTYHL